LLIVTGHLMSQAGAEGVKWGWQKQAYHKDFFVHFCSRKVGRGSAWRGSGTEGGSYSLSPGYELVVGRGERGK
jgi:hypothetical protein